MNSGIECGHSGRETRKGGRVSEPGRGESPAIFQTMIDYKGTDEELSERLRDMISGDPEVDHGNADNLLVHVLNDNGFPLLAKEFDIQAEHFWYA